MAARLARKYGSAIPRRRSLLLRDPLITATPAAAVSCGLHSNYRARSRPLLDSGERNFTSRIGRSSSSASSPRSVFFTAPALWRDYITEGRSHTIDEEVRSSSQSISNSEQQSVQASTENEAGDGAPSVDAAVDSAVKASSPRHDLAMLFTCNVCGIRSAKTMSRASYDTGVVIVRCPGCRNLHLIADRYGWFGEPGSVETFLAEKGLDVRTGSENSYEFSMEDLSGWTPKGSVGK